MKDEIKKVQNGQFFTITNPFYLKAFYAWYEQIPEESRKVILEPFAGANNIVKLINELNLCDGKQPLWKCYDIDISHENQFPEYVIEQRDTINNYPNGFDTVITNPPYLAKNSATRKNLNYPNTSYDDLYKYCLDVMLNGSKYVAAIIPESFITANLFRNRLYSVISLTCKMFDDTECPVCLALFIPKAMKELLGMNTNDFYVFRMNRALGLYSGIENKIAHLFPMDIEKYPWKFNDTEGSVGIQCIDGTKRASISFVNGDTIPKDKIKVSSRSLTRVSGLPEGVNLQAFLERCNAILKEYRFITSDICLTSFKGLREDNEYRRRLDFKSAKQIMDTALYTLKQEVI